MHALQDLGEALVALDGKRLAELDLPERLSDAIQQARSIRAHEGRRRQIQYIGKLMRDIDAEPIRQTLERWASGAPDDNARYAAAEVWRERVLADDAAITEFIAAFPRADGPALGALVRDARIERTRNGPPHRYRALFRTLTTEMKRSAATRDTADSDE